MRLPFSPDERSPVRDGAGVVRAGESQCPGLARRFVANRISGGYDVGPAQRDAARFFLQKSFTQWGGIEYDRGCRAIALPGRRSIP